MFPTKLSHVIFFHKTHTPTIYVSSVVLACRVSRDMAHPQEKSIPFLCLNRNGSQQDNSALIHISLYFIFIVPFLLPHQIFPVFLAEFSLGI